MIFGPFTISSCKNFMIQTFRNPRKGGDFDWLFQLKATNFFWSFWVGNFNVTKDFSWGHWHLLFGVLFFATIMWDVCFSTPDDKLMQNACICSPAGYKLLFPVWIHACKKPASISLHLFHQLPFGFSLPNNASHPSPNPPGCLNARKFFWRTHGIVHLRVLKHLKQRQDHHNLGGFCFCFTKDGKLVASKRASLNPPHDFRKFPWREIRCGPELKQEATTSFSKWL